jgi:hypothetical protein
MAVTPVGLLQRAAEESEAVALQIHVLADDLSRRGLRSESVLLRTLAEALNKMAFRCARNEIQVPELLTMTRHVQLAMMHCSAQLRASILDVAANAVDGLAHRLGRLHLEISKSTPSPLIQARALVPKGAIMTTDDPIRVLHDLIVTKTEVLRELAQEIASDRPSLALRLHATVDILEEDRDDLEKVRDVIEILREVENKMHKEGLNELAIGVRNLRRALSSAADSLLTTTQRFSTGEYNAEQLEQFERKLLERNKR